MKIRTAFAIAGLALLAACQTTSDGAGSWCAVNSPQRPSAAEVAAMSAERVRQVLSFNRLGAKRCGWAP